MNLIIKLNDYYVISKFIHKIDCHNYDNFQDLKFIHEFKHVLKYKIS